MSSPTGATGPSQPTPSSSQIEGALRDALIALVVKQFTTWLLENLPVWLPVSIANPLIAIIVAPIMSWIVGKLIDLTILGVNEAWIRVETNADVQAVQQAAQNLQNLPPDASASDIAAAQEAFQQAAGNLITIHPAPIPQG